MQTNQPDVRLTGRYVEEVEEGKKYEGFIQFKVGDEDKKICFIISLSKHLGSWDEEERMLRSYFCASKLAKIQVFTPSGKLYIGSEKVMAILLSLSLPSVLHFYAEKSKKGDTLRALTACGSSSPRVNEVFAELIACQRLFYD